MKAIERAVGATATALAVGGLCVLLILAAFTLLDGLLRAVANHPLDIVREIGDLVAAICGACCLPIVLLHKGNITLRVFDRLVRASAVRAIDAFADLLVEIVMIAMAWQFCLYSIKTMRAGDVTWLLNLPKAPFWFAVDAVLWIAVAVQTFALVRTLAGSARARPSETPP